MCCLKLNAYKLKTLSSTDCTDFRRLDGEKCYLCPDRTPNPCYLKLNAYKLKTSFPHRDALRVEFFDFVLGSRGGRGRFGDFDFDEGFGEGFGVDVT